MRSVLSEMRPLMFMVSSPGDPRLEVAWAGVRECWTASDGIAQEIRRDPLDAPPRRGISLRRLTLTFD